MPFTLRVVSPDRLIFEDNADFLLLRGEEGELGILPNHAPLMTTLKPGPVTIRSKGEEHLLFVGGGFLEVLPDRVTILATSGEWAADIDEARAEVARRRAEELLAQQIDEQTRAEALAQLERAIQRLRIVELRRKRAGAPPESRSE
jgi:F-type H+-transporting ATPase subunit epsilon